MDNVEVKVNVINQLKLLRQSTFKDKLSFLDEDIQNAQRAKATEVKVTVDYMNKSVIIENNGKILENPQALFSIAESEWDDDVKESESPFGMGFFSNITVSDNIEVFSGDKHIIFNVAAMIRDNKTDIEVKKICENYDGFKLILNNFDFNQVSQYSICERVKILGNYIHELDIYLDGTIQQKKDLTEGDGSVFLTKIENEPNFTGWIALNIGFSQDVKVFYKGRYVTNIDSFYYAKGDIHINDKTLNLTAPDRKDIIRDSKYYEFVNKIKGYVQELANQSFLTGDQNEIERHIDSISQYADKSKLKNEMTFLVFDTESENDSKYLKDIALARRKNNGIKNINDYQVFLKQEAARQTEEHFVEITIDSEVKEKAPKARGVRYHEGNSGSPGEYERPEIDEDKLEERKGKKIDFKEEPVFWLGFDEIVEQEGKFKIAQHYGLKVIVSRNKFESSVLQLLGKEQNIVHISELKEDTRIKATISNTELSLKEKRALMLLDMISRVSGLNDNVFGIGDVMVIKETNVEVLNHTMQNIEDNFVAVYDYKNKKVYMDRTVIDKSKLREDLEENLDLEDYKFILLNLKEIVRELGIVEFKKPDDLYGVIVQSIAAA